MLFIFYNHDLPKFGDWLETVYAESVAEADGARYIARFMEEKADRVRCFFSS